MILSEQFVCPLGSNYTSKKKTSAMGGMIYYDALCDESCLTSNSL